MEIVLANVYTECNECDQTIAGYKAFPSVNGVGPSSGNP